MTPIDWLLTPMSGSLEHHIAPWASWHARWMVVGWCILLPLGAVVARYFKIMPRQRWPQQLDNRAWFHGHRVLQWSGIAAMSIGAWLAWGHGAGVTPSARLHAAFGWALVAFGWLQIGMALFRGSKGGPTEPRLRGDHYDMTAHRIRFERLHKGLGWLSVLTAAAVTALGLYLADAPRWMGLTLGLWWALLAAAAWHWQRQGRCIDTYQAIWGPDPQHPGNRLRPVGWGVRRSRS